MHMAEPDDYVTFGPPSIGPRAYVVKGPSGWVEAFAKTASDTALRVFLNPLPVDEAVMLFVTQRELSENKTATEWFTIVGFLGRTMKMTPKAVPHAAAVSFWAAVILYERAQGAN
jgi:hypothetical protein